MMKVPGYPVAWSECRRYRYTLWRIWNTLEQPLRYVQFIGLNPSTADELTDDPTIRRCIGFAKSWGYGGLCMTNLFAFRATDPRQMMACPAPIGDANDDWILQVAKGAGIVVACWGTRGSFMGRDRDLFDVLDPYSIELRCIRLNGRGVPGHPLYLPAHLQPEPFDPSEVIQ